MPRPSPPLVSAAALVTALVAVLGLRDETPARRQHPEVPAGVTPAPPPVPRLAPPRQPMPAEPPLEAVAISAPTAEPLGEPPDGRLTLGWVLDPDGRPVEGARVTPWRSSGLVRRLDPALAAWSDASGRFEVRCDPLGTSALVVEHPLFLPFDGVPEDSPATITLRAPVPVALRVLDERGAPAAGARLRVRLDDPHAAWREHLADAEGRLELREGAARGLTVAAEAAHGFLPARHVQPRAGEEVVLTLTATRVRAVRVVDAAGAPLANARVVLLPPHEARALSEARTDARGVATLAVPAPGEARLAAEHPRGWFRPVAVGAADAEVVLRSEPCGVLAITTTRTLPVELASPGDPDAPALRVHVRADRPCKIPLRAGRWLATWSEAPGASPTTRVLALPAGRETALAIEPPAAASLAVALGGDREGVIGVELAPLGTPGARVQPLEADGTARIEALAPGRYTLALLAEGGGRWVEPGLVVLAPGEPRRLELAPILATRTLVVRTAGGIPLATASARLEDAPVLPGGGAARSGARLVERAPALPFAGADEAGCVRLALCPAGPARVRVQAPGFAPALVTLTDDVTHVDLHREDS